MAEEEEEAVDDDGEEEEVALDDDDEEEEKCIFCLLNCFKISMLIYKYILPSPLPPLACSIL